MIRQKNEPKLNLIQIDPHVCAVEHYTYTDAKNKLFFFNTIFDSGGSYSSKNIPWSHGFLFIKKKKSQLDYYSNN